MNSNLVQPLVLVLELVLDLVLVGAGRAGSAYPHGAHANTSRGGGMGSAHTCTQRALAESGVDLGSRMDDSPAILRAWGSGYLESAGAPH